MRTMVRFMGSRQCEDARICLNGLSGPACFHDSGRGRASRFGRWKCCLVMVALFSTLCFLQSRPLEARNGDFVSPGKAGKSTHKALAAKPVVGWAVGGVSDGYGTILHTTNGGRTWVRQGVQAAIADVALVGVAAVDAREAWVVGGGVILHTRDGGQTWCREANDPGLTGGDLISISAVDIYTAWAVGAGGAILRTTNGGCTWERQGAGQVPVVSLSGVYAADASHVWVVGGPEEGNRYGTILRTTDGGTTWAKVPYTITHDPSLTSFYLITVHGANANQVWTVGRAQIMHISVTSKGVTVTDQTQKFSNFMDVNGVFALNPLTVWAVGDSANIWRTDNGGKTWTLRNKGDYDHGYIFRVSAVNGLHAWASEGSAKGTGQILYTSNGGKTWTAQTIPAQPQIWGISFVR
jgi:photosystem II stability/assembly factor-like uncharacterized protein